jgi:hypothetical protein
LHRLAHELPGQFLDALRVSGREQQGLPLFRALFGNRGDVIEKAHVQHAVGLVQHQGVERLQVQILTRQVIHDAPRRPHHDMRAMLQRGTLAAQGHAAAQGDNLDVVCGPRQPADLGSHLVGQLTRRAQHQGLHRKAARVQLGQQGQGESGRLTTARFGLRNQVFARQRGGQAGRLDRRHRQIAQLLQIGQRGGVQGQGCEAGARKRGGGSGSHLGVDSTHGLIIGIRPGNPILTAAGGHG